jgi:single-stranded DNA-binding protein
MSQDTNYVELSGTMTSEVEIVYANSGAKIASFEFAMKGYQGKEDFVIVKCFKGLADEAESTGWNGAAVSLKGRLSGRRWEGNKVMYFVEVVANELTIQANPSMGSEPNFDDELDENGQPIVPF